MPGCLKLFILCILALVAIDGITAEAAPKVSVISTSWSQTYTNGLPVRCIKGKLQNNNSYAVTVYNFNFKLFDGEGKNVGYAWADDVGQFDRIKPHQTVNFTAHPPGHWTMGEWILNGSPVRFEVNEIVVTKFQQ